MTDEINIAITEDQIKDIIHRSINDTHECEDEDKISIQYIEVNETKYAIYLRYNRSQWPLLFLMNLSTTEVVEIDHGLKGGPLEIKSEDVYILMRGRLWGQGTIDDWYKYSIEPLYFIGPV